MFFFAIPEPISRRLLHLCIMFAARIELGDGHYWINEPEIEVNFPLRIIGDEKDPSHVVIELSGTISWKGSVGFMEGITFRRPRISDDTAGREMLRIDSGNLSFVNGVLEGAKEKSAEKVIERPIRCGVIVRGTLRMENVSHDFITHNMEFQHHI